MADETISPQISVAELLASHPAAVLVLIKHRMACVGCPMARFETLEGAARIYGVSVQELCNEVAGKEVE